ncbi:MAG TPA: hypothetical protein EYQ00_01710 [Dehalococcoidia bacterium]|nr:hypothetical protein [Dehalococcoidia bacterium]
MQSHLVPEKFRDSKNWPKRMQDEWNSEEACALDHQRRHKEALLKVREAIDAFSPDVVIIFGDDQYENFKENVIPPFNMYCMDQFPSAPFELLKMLGGGENIWGVDNSHSYDIPGAGKLAREIAHGIISNHVPIAYSYEYLNHDHLTHAFANALVFLDWEKKGWNYPIIPLSVNCYGTGVIHTRGGMAHLFDERPDSEKDPYLDFPGPAGPTPLSCYRVGAALRETLNARPERFVVMASSGWSHAFLTKKNHWLWPDRGFDLERVDELRKGEQSKWAEISNESIEDAGCQEFKNWICLAGVFPERQASVIDYIDTWIFNSQKCFALLE